MEDLKYLYKALKRGVEKVAGRKMCTPRDYNYLVADIQRTTHETLSPTTLKRFWGYLDKGREYVPMKHTLDVLSIYVGYKNWETYCIQSSVGNKSESAPVKSKTLYSTSLKPGDIVILRWNPNRCVTVRHLGEDLFVVEKSVNSKLDEGDRFCCGVFIMGEPLYLSRHTRGETVLGAYICGRDNGVDWSVIFCNRGG